MKADGAEVGIESAGPGGEIAVLTLHNPPSNALSAPLRAALVRTFEALSQDGGAGSAATAMPGGDGATAEGLGRASGKALENLVAGSQPPENAPSERQPLRMGAPPAFPPQSRPGPAVPPRTAPAALRGVVLAVRGGRGFGAASALDLPEGDSRLQPDLARLCALVEDCPLPVVAVLEGAVGGPWAELTLAAHARVAADGARFSLPGIALGLPPNSGATQRLPRLVGTATAVEILLDGVVVTPEAGLAAGLVDRLGGEVPLEAAVALARAMRAPRPVSARPVSSGLDGLSGPEAHRAAIGAARARLRPAPLSAPARILDCVEAALYLPFANGVAMEAVAHEDLEASAESRALRAAARAGRRACAMPARARPAEVAVLGLRGLAGAQAVLAQHALARGLRVRWQLADRAAAATARRWLEARLDADLRAGRVQALARDADLARLDLGVDEVEAAGLVVHVPDAAPRPPARDAVHLALGGGDGMAGLALAPSARLSELACPEGMAARDVATAAELLRRIGLPAVLTGGRPVLGRRMAWAGRAALERLLAAGVARDRLASALSGFGQGAGPLADLGADRGPEMAQTEMAGEEILSRWLAALANEGIALLSEGVARRASDIDHVMVEGHGFPRWRGGPMYQADLRGAMVLRADLRLWAAEDPAWTPHPGLDRILLAGPGALA
ncbi:enoyl-CoA hydratase-related protein [Pseudogemmobacter sonorensis]|uniref:enoyl-CoA hydratase-related protein n=1 Tax=Pseudogemmobacter sonorensis TaxID=2989681 RepID=UPI0036CB3ECA